MNILNKGNWIKPIVVINSASKSFPLATDLQKELEKITGIAPTLTSETSIGIRVGTYDEWKHFFTMEGIDYNFQYCIKTEADSISILGINLPALEQGIWRFLEELGFRQFFPTAAWEVIPRKKNIDLEINLKENKNLDVLHGLGLACGAMPYTIDSIEKWKKKNRIPSPYGFPSGHVWNTIISENQEAFDLHPEYMSKDGKKFCVLESAVQEFALAYAKNKARQADAAVISLTATDGVTGWDDICENTNEQAFMNPSDRQIYLANFVQTQLDLDSACNGARVSILAYGEASVKPTIQIHPRVIIVVADRYIKDGRTINDVTKDYIEAGAVDIGPYFYFSIWTWDRNVPGRSLASSEPRVIEAVKYFYQQQSNLKFIALEASDSWGPDGLGYYLFSKLISTPTPINLEEAAIEIKQDFFSKAFGLAAEPMQKFYDLISSDINKPLLSSDLIHHMYLQLQTAWKLVKKNVRARIADLIKYTRYVELLVKFRNCPAGSEEEFNAFELMMAYLYRIRLTQMVNYRCNFYDTAYTNLWKKLDQKYGYELTPYRNLPWEETPFSNLELKQIMADGILNNTVQPFASITYDYQNLGKPNKFNLDLRSNGFLNYTRGDLNWYLHTGIPNFIFTTRAGRVYDTKGNSVIKFWKDKELIKTIYVPPDNITKTHNVELLVGELYRIEIVDAGGLEFKYSSTYAVSHLLEIDALTFQGDFSGYFYVPKDVLSVGGFWKKIGSRIFNSDGQLMATNTTLNSFFNIPTTPETVGKVWFADRLNGDFILMTVPQLFAFHPKQLLLPTELIERDQLAPVI